MDRHVLHNNNRPCFSNALSELPLVRGRGKVLCSLRTETKTSNDFRSSGRHHTHHRTREAARYARRGLRGTLADTKYGSRSHQDATMLPSLAPPQATCWNFGLQDVHSTTTRCSNNATMSWREEEVSTLGEEVRPDIAAPVLPSGEPATEK